jgi:CRISPR-associated endonuclease Csn1
MKNEEYISNFFIKIYDQHRKNLDALKSFLYINNKEMLNEFFSKNGSHYARVIGHDKNRDVVCDKTKDKNREREDYVRDHELFVKHIRENIHDKYKEKFENDSNFKTAFGNIDNDEFYLSTQHYANKISNFPFQLHLVELKEILNNVSEHWSFLSKRDEELSILTKDKIIKILEFKMPYYVGLTSNAGWESLSKNELDRRKP